MFFTVVLSGALLMSVYLGWRAGSVPLVRRLLPWWARGLLLIVLGSAYVLARDADERGWTIAARVLEFAGAYWIGILLLLFVAMLAADAALGAACLFRRRLPRVHAWALVAGLGLSLVALVQGHRPPVVREYAVSLAGLPQGLDGTQIVFISDLHLGSMLGEEWLGARVEQINAMHPAAILLGGDILEGDSPSEAALLPILGRLKAPLGVWAVAGNHERHGGGSTLDALERVGVRVLRNEWREVAPGLVLAGAEHGRSRDDDEPTAGGRSDRSMLQPGAARLQRSLSNRPAGAAVVLISHQPRLPQIAARAGVGLMLSGHTHDGQIWPFRYLVRLETPYLAGRYDVEGMPLIACRGTGTFGPRMRLWYPSEILRITLRAGNARSAPIL
jgi:predicted MPP superfamily phosphohydrolase